jgi:Zn-dependent protease with chaperone function
VNFFERQRDARLLSRRLVALFALAVLGVVVAANLVVAALLVLVVLTTDDTADLVYGSVLPVLFVITTVVTVVCMAGASVRRTRALRRGGGSTVIEELGGQVVPPDTTDPALRRLRNVVEETAIASAVPVPAVYVLPREAGINALAAGNSTADAALAVTAGALEWLNRDELQGVVAHEFSHLVHGDVRLNIRLMGTLHGIVALHASGKRIYHRRNPFAAVGMGMTAAGFVGVLVARMVKAAVSRQREYLADASAVRYTRQSAGLVGALKKIAGHPHGSTVDSTRSEEVSHMLFGEHGEAHSRFATHPPLAYRIHALDPTFDPGDLDRLTRWRAEPRSGMEEDRALGLTEPAPLPDPHATVRLTPADVVAAVGDPSPASLEQAAAILASLSPALLDRARNPDTVVPLVFGLLLSPDPAVRETQLAALGEPVEPLGDLHPMLRLPLAELAFPLLRGRADVLERIDALIAADDRVDVFEYCLSRLLRGPVEPAPTRPLAEAEREVAVLMSVLDGTDGVTALDGALPMLAGLAGPDKQSVVAGMVSVLGHDGVLAVQEIELLRTVCAMLHCPLPPLGPDMRK